MDHPAPGPARLRVSLFAGMAATAGRRTWEFDWQGGTVGDLRRRLAAACPEIAALLGRSTIAIGDRYAGDGEPIPADAAVAIIPPVSGG